MLLVQLLGVCTPYRFVIHRTRIVVYFALIEGHLVEAGDDLDINGTTFVGAV